MLFPTSTLLFTLLAFICLPLASAVPTRVVKARDSLTKNSPIPCTNPCFPVGGWTLSGIGSFIGDGYQCIYSTSLGDKCCQYRGSNNHSDKDNDDKCPKSLTCTPKFKRSFIEERDGEMAQKIRKRQWTREKANEAVARNQR